MNLPDRLLRIGIWYDLDPKWKRHCSIRHRDNINKNNCVAIENGKVFLYFSPPEMQIPFVCNNAMVVYGVLIARSHLHDRAGHIKVWPDRFFCIRNGVPVEMTESEIETWMDESLFRALLEGKI